MSESLPRSMSSSLRCEPDRLLIWLGQVLAALDGVDVHIVVEQAPDARSFVQITLHDVPSHLAEFEMRRLA